MLPQKCLINVPVADLRHQPTPICSYDQHDPLQETQLLMGEQAHIIDEKDDWVKIEALEQPFCGVDGKWSGYPGWVLKSQIQPLDSFPATSFTLSNDLWTPVFTEPSISSNPIYHLSLGTRLPVCDTQPGWTRLTLPDGQTPWVASNSATELTPITLAKQLLGSPYRWGGRSAYLSNALFFSGVDCSGLVQLVYRVLGFNLPRNAHDQFLRSTPVAVDALQPGDLIFSEKKCSPGRITHVMLFVQDNQLLEATDQVNRVRLVSAKEKFGVNLEKSPVKDSIVYSRQIENLIDPHSLSLDSK